MTDFKERSVSSLLPAEEQIQAKKMAIHRMELDSIPVSCLPEVKTQDYYFISYSHQDYREVYEDLFDLQMEGLPFWYDQGIPAGENWKDIVEKYISPYACKGVVFYLSENALASTPILQELLFAQQVAKPYLAILIPSKGRSTIRALVEGLYEDGRIDISRRDVLLKAFPEDKLYLPLSMHASNKKRKILLASKKQEILDIDIVKSGYFRSSFINMQRDCMEITLGPCNLQIRGLNDAYAKQIRTKDFQRLLKNKDLVKKAVSLDEGRHLRQELTNAPKGAMDELGDVVIGAASFANSRHLEKMDIPFRFTLRIDAYAFFRCERLQEVRLRPLTEEDAYLVGIADHAFSGCTSLRAFDFRNVGLGEGSFEQCKGLEQADLRLYGDEAIPESCFSGCSSLKEVRFPKGLTALKDSCFYHTSIVHLTLPHSLKEIGNYAFSWCQKLEKVLFPSQLRHIGKEAFCGCVSLVSISLPHSLQTIEENAFGRCESLRLIEYAGSLEELHSIAHRNFLGAHKQPIRIVCADKEILVPGNR